MNRIIYEVYAWYNVFKTNSHNELYILFGSYIWQLFAVFNVFCFRKYRFRDPKFKFWFGEACPVTLLEL
jgi:hypothetical protein